MKEIIFISHANPEDNLFARWLYSQLSKEGYLVWCDLPMLIGGEDWWRDIETVLRNKSIKFIYILSKSSNYKDGSLKELRLALTIFKNDKLHDFILPIHIDDLPYHETNIELQSYIQIPFNDNWAKGLKQLLDKLERDKVPKSSTISPQLLNSWWGSQFNASQGVFELPDEYLSNWFSIKELPSVLYFHRLNENGFNYLSSLPFSYLRMKEYLITFAPSADTCKIAKYIEDTIPFNMEAFLNAKTEGRKIPFKEAKRMVIQLLNSSWLNLIQLRSLPTYKFADGVECFYFPKDHIKEDKIHFDGINKVTFRKICGAVKERYWHFGIRATAILYPEPAYVLSPHVLFSDDGHSIWESKEKLHKVRRSACKNWWNEEWRDRILATMSWFSNSAGEIIVPTGEISQITIANKPILFTANVSYKDPEKKKTRVAIEDEGVELDIHELDDFNESEI